MKKIVSTILTVLMLMTIFPLCSFATEITSGDFHDFWDTEQDAVVCDLNFDGSPDTIKTEVYGNYYGHFNLIINGQRFTIGVMRHGGYDHFCITDIDPGDNFLDIIAFESYKGSINASIFRYDGENLYVSGSYDVTNEPLTEDDADMDARYARIKINTGDGSIHFDCAPENHSYASLSEFSPVEIFPVYLNGEKLAFDQPPVKVYFQTEAVWGERILVPLRAIFEALGATVSWDDATQTATAVKGDKTVSITIDSQTLYINGEAKTLDATAILVHDRTMVPIRAISEAFDCNVDWNETEQAVYIVQ